MAIVEATIGGGGLYSNVVGVNVQSVVSKINPPVVWLHKANWTNAENLVVNVAADMKGKPLASAVLVEAAYDGAFKNIAAGVTSMGPTVDLGRMKSSQVWVRARYAGSLSA